MSIEPIGNKVNVLFSLSSIQGSVIKNILFNSYGDLSIDKVDNLIIGDGCDVIVIVDLEFDSVDRKVCRLVIIWLDC